MATKTISTAGYLTLTNGDKSQWFDMQSVAAAEFNLVITGVATVIIRGANDTTIDSAISAAKADQKTLDTFTASKGGTIFEPMPRFIQFEMTAGAGSAVFSWGKALDHKGGLATVSPQGVRTTVSSEFSPS